MRIVAALGGNALLERGERPDSDLQESHVRAAMAALLPLARAHSLVITHGNGPQVGLLATESGQDPVLARPYPFDVLVAQTQGMIGYWLMQALGNMLPGGQAACLLTRTLIRADGPAWRRVVASPESADLLAAMGLLADAPRLLAGEAGTVISGPGPGRGTAADWGTE